MHSDDTLKRFDRIVAILIQLQSKKIVKAADLAQRFDVSLRTIYRDIRTLETAGIPIYSEAGTGYSLMEGYRLPPVMFTKEEAGSFIAAERLMERFSDASFKKNFQSAVFKIKSVLRSSEKDWLAAIETSVQVSQRALNERKPSPEVLGVLFDSIAQQKQVKTLYHSMESEKPMPRLIEPVTIYHEFDHWYVNAYCHWRKDYRHFRTDRILHIALTEKAFEKEHTNREKLLKQTYTVDALQQEVRLLMEKKFARYTESKRNYFGFREEIDRGNEVELVFDTDLENSGMERWLLSFADCITIVSPPILKEKIQKITQQIQQNLAR